jgi:hypothetical protein
VASLRQRPPQNCGPQNGAARTGRVPEPEPKQQVDYIQELSEQSYLTDRTLSCSALVVTVDVDAALEGDYALKFTPRLPADLLSSGKITVELEVHGRKQVLGRMYVGE